VTPSFLDRLVTCPGFAISMRKVGWLEGRENALLFPNFARHNGQTAKNRALTQNRMKRLRNAQSVTQPSPDKIREDKISESYSLGAPTLKEWLDHATLIGYEPKEAETAWNKLEAFSWELQGNAIHDWKKMAQVFKTRNQEHVNKQKTYERSSGKPSGQRTPTIEEIIDVPTMSFGKKS
jgi:hypothetical protein